jgi:hypothetical protein
VIKSKKEFLAEDVMKRLHNEIARLDELVKADPEDYLTYFEAEELKQKAARLVRINKLGLELIIGGKESCVLKLLR